jgi:hypothetical protein
MSARRLLCLLPALAVLALSAGLAACGTTEDKQDLAEGEPFELGELQYNVLFSRFLNPDDIEDAEYLAGQPPPDPDQLYLGVFVQILNKNKESPETIPSGWVVTDTDENNYLPLPSESPYALHFDSQIPPEDQVPALDSTPEVGPIAGSMVLFTIPDIATESRPLELIIPGEGGPAKVHLDA